MKKDKHCNESISQFYLNTLILKSLEDPLKYILFNFYLAMNLTVTIYKVFWNKCNFNVMPYVLFAQKRIFPWFQWEVCSRVPISFLDQLWEENRENGERCIDKRVVERRKREEKRREERRCKESLILIWHFVDRLQHATLWKTSNDNQRQTMPNFAKKGDKIPLISALSNQSYLNHDLLNLE